MCRKDRLLSLALISFGVGLMAGSLIGAGFWCTCLSFSAIGLGLAVIKMI